MPINVDEILAGSAALMNDTDRNVYTNAVQLPYFKMGYDDLRQELEENGISIADRTSAALEITTDMYDIGGPTGPALPLDFVEPLELWERASGSTNDYLLMDKRQFLPKTEVLTAYLQVWAYQNQIIKLLGATSDIQVKIDYIGDPLSNVIDEFTQIRLYNASNFLKYRTAALCAEFIGEDESRAASCNNNASRALNTLMNIGIKGQQAIYTRRRPFRSRAKMNGWGSNGW